MSSMGWEPTVSYDDKQALYGKSAKEIAASGKQYLINGTLDNEVYMSDEGESTAVLHFAKCRLDNQLDNQLPNPLPQIIPGYISSAAAGTIVAAIVEDIEGNQRFLDCLLNDSGSHADEIVDHSLKYISVDLYPVEDTRHIDNETGVAVGHICQFFIMPPSNVSICLMLNDGGK